jgi:uncharacterized protein YutE (UPF0331/DUF86 family)
MSAAAIRFRPGTAEALESIAGFRNILVHDYLRLDRELVHQFLRTRLDALRRFAADIADFLSRTEGSLPGPW